MPGTDCLFAKTHPAEREDFHMTQKHNSYDSDFVHLVHYDKEVFDDGCMIHKKNCIHPNILGVVVGYMTVFLLNDKNNQVFTRMLHGARIKMGLCGGEHLARAEALLEKIQGLDDESILSLCKLSTFDVWANNPSVAAYAITEEDVNPDTYEIQDIRTMVTRNVAFWKKAGMAKDKSGFMVPYGITETSVETFFDDDTLKGLQEEREDVEAASWFSLFWYWQMAADYNAGSNATKRTVSVFQPALNTSVRLQMVNQLEK